MRKLQTTGKAGSRTGKTLPGTRTSGSGAVVPFEFQLHQQPQTTIFRPSQVKFRWVSIPRQKQRSQTPARCITANASSGEGHSVRYASARHMFSLRIRYKQDLTHRRSRQPAIGSSRRNPAGNTRISSTCCCLPSLSCQYHCHHPTRVFCRSCWFKAGCFYKHSTTKISYECATDSGVADHAFWRNSENIRRNHRKCRSRHFLCRSVCISGSSRPDAESIFNLVRRDRLVSSRNSAMVMGSYFRRSESVSTFVKSQQQSVETSYWKLFRLSNLRSVGKLFDISSSDAPALPEPFDSRFSKGLRSRSRSQKTWGMGRQRVEKGDEALESLSHWTNFAKTTESGYETNTQQIQDFGEMRTSIRRQIYGSTLQKPQKKVACSLVFRKISRKGRADKQSSGKGFAKACYLEKNFTGQQVSEWTNVCPEVNDNYYFSWPTGPECNGIYRNNAQKFPGGISTAKTELKCRCLNQQNHFAYSTVENRKIFEQSSAHAKIRSCGSATT